MGEGSKIGQICRQKVVKNCHQERRRGQNLYIFEMQPSFYDRYLSTSLIHPMEQASQASSSSGNTFQPKVSLGNKSLLEK